MSKVVRDECHYHSHWSASCCVRSGCHNTNCENGPFCCRILTVCTASCGVCKGYASSDHTNLHDAHFVANVRGSAYGVMPYSDRSMPERTAEQQMRAYQASKRLTSSAYGGAAAASSAAPPVVSAEVIEVRDSSPGSPPRGPSTTKPPPSGEPFVFNKSSGAAPAHPPWLCSSEDACGQCVPPGSQPAAEDGRSLKASSMFASAMPPARALDYEDAISLKVPGLPPPRQTDDNPAPFKAGRFNDESKAVRTFTSSLNMGHGAVAPSIDLAAVARRRIVPQPVSRFVNSPKAAKVAPPVRPLYTLARESPASAAHVAIDMPPSHDIEALVMENSLLKSAKDALEKEKEMLHTANIKLQDALQKAHMAKVKDDHLLLYCGGVGASMVKKEAETRIATARAQIEALSAGSGDAGAGGAGAGGAGAGGASDNGNGSLDFILRDKAKTQHISRILFDAQHSGRINPETEGVSEVMKYGYNRLEATRIVVMWMDNHAELTIKYGCKCHKQGRPHTRCLSHHARSTCNGLNGCHRVPEADLII